MEDRSYHKNALLIGVTGGVGSGKSAVMDILSREFRVHTILADKVGHELMEPGRANYKGILEEFGRDILCDGGSSIDREKLGSIVFADPDKLKKLNQITHSGVVQEIRARISLILADGGVKETDKEGQETSGGAFGLVDRGTGYVGSKCIPCREDEYSAEYQGIPFDRPEIIAVEAALLIGSDLEQELDSLWYIYVDDEERIRRLQESRGYTREYAVSILKKQLSDQEFRNRCDVIIDNSGRLEDTERQVGQALARLIRQ